MAELVAKATASFITDSNVTSNSIKVGVELLLLNRLGPDQPCALERNALKSAMHHPARASSDVASSLADSGSESPSSD